MRNLNAKDNESQTTNQASNCSQSITLLCFHTFSRKTSTRTCLWSVSLCFHFGAAGLKWVFTQIIHKNLNIPWFIFEHPGVRGTNERNPNSSQAPRATHGGTFWPALPPCCLWRAWERSLGSQPSSAALRPELSDLEHFFFWTGSENWLELAQVRLRNRTGSRVRPVQLRNRSGSASDRAESDWFWLQNQPGLPSDWVWRKTGPGPVRPQVNTILF